VILARGIFYRSTFDEQNFRSMIGGAASQSGEQLWSISLGCLFQDKSLERAFD
jgi:hypothetical protein